MTTREQELETELERAHAMTKRALRVAEDFARQAGVDLSSGDDDDEPIADDASTDEHDDDSSDDDAYVVPLAKLNRELAAVQADQKANGLNPGNCQRKLDIQAEIKTLLQRQRTEERVRDEYLTNLRQKAAYGTEKDFQRLWRQNRLSLLESASPLAQAQHQRLYTKL